MSNANIEGSTNPQHNLTPAEIDNRNRLEAVAQRGLESYVEVDSALAEIRDQQLYRDSHSSFETYVRERWGVNVPNGRPLPPSAIGADGRVTLEREPDTALRSKPCEDLARACEETLSALAGDDRMGIEIRLAVRKQEDPRAPAGGRSIDLWGVAGSMGDELLPTLRWLLTQAGGTVGEVAHRLESHASELDDRARAQLRDDVLLLDDELEVVKAALVELIDWDADLKRLLKDELPPFDPDRLFEDGE